MLNKYLLAPLAALLLLAAPRLAQAQTTPGVGIGTTAPDVSAALDIVSSSKGLLLPRLTAAQVAAIATPATGLLVFQTDGTPGFYYNVGSPAAPNWQQIATASGAALTATNGLTKTGASIGLGGTLTGNTSLALGGFGLGLTGGRVGIGLAPTSAGLQVSTDEKPSVSGTTGVFLSGGASGNPNIELRGTNGFTYIDFVNDLTSDFNGRIMNSAAGMGLYLNSSLTPRLLVSPAGNVSISTLAGGGTKVIIADNNGTLATAPLPTPQTLDLSGSTLSLSGGGGSVTLPTATGGDNLGNHTATQNLGLGNYWLSYATGTSTGLRIASDGKVGVGVASPTATLDVDGGIVARGNGLISNQGAHLQWNRSGFQGETWLLNQQGGGAGGIVFGASDNVSSGSNTVTEWGRFDGGGTLRLGADGGNVAGTGPALEWVGPGVNTDPVGLYRVNPGFDQSELRVVVGDNPDASDKFVVGHTSVSGVGQIPGGTFSPKFSVSSAGQVNVAGLAGTGTRLVTTDANGNLGTATGVGDNLGNHTATTNLGLNGNWLSNAPGNANGIRVANDGKVGLGVAAPSRQLDVAGDAAITGAVQIGTPGSATSAGSVDITGSTVAPGLTLDQQQLTGGYGGGALDQWQSFTAGVSGNLTRLDLRINSPTGADGAVGTLTVYDGEGVAGTLLTSQSIVMNAVSNTFQQYPLNTPVPVLAGRRYTYRLQTPTMTMGFVASGNDPYPGGINAVGNGNGNFDVYDGDLLFKTYVNVLASTALKVTGNTRLVNLASASTRMVTASGDGTLGAAVIPVDTDAQQLSLNSSGVLNLTNGGSVTLPDASAINELQTITKNAATGVVTLSAGGGSFTDADAQTLSISTAASGSTISISGVTGTGASIIVPSSADNLGNHTATQKLDLQGNALVGNGGSTGLTISNAGAVTTAGALTTNGALTATGATRLTSLTGTGSRMVTTAADGTLGSSALPADAQQLSISGGTIGLTNGGSVTLPDASATNELQTISKSGSTVTLSNSGGSFTDADNQNLGLSGASLSISGGTGVTLPDASATNELQTLSISGSTLSISGVTGTGSSITVPGDNLGNHTATTNLNLATYALVGNGGSTGLTISNAGAVTTAGALSTGGNASVGGTLTATGATRLTSLTGTGSRMVTTAADGTLGSSALPTDAQQLDLSSGVLSLTNGGSVTLPDASATNELQMLSISGSTLSISGVTGTGSSITVPGDNLGNHTATQNLNLGPNALVGNGGTTGLQLTSGGNVGVGTAAPVTQLANSASNVIGTDGNGVSTQALNWVSTTTGYAAGLANTNAASNGHGLALKIASANAGTAALDISQGTLASPGTSLLRVRGDGQVGIGTSSPTQRLDVEGGILARGNGPISNQGAYLQWNRSGGAGETWLINQQGGGSGGIRFGSATTSNTVTEWARFDGSGNLGLGTTNPSQKLDVRGNLRLGDDGAGVGTGPAIEWVGPGFSTDPVGIYRVNTAADQSQLRVVVGDNPDANDKFVVGRMPGTSSEGGIPGGTFTPSFTVRGDGNVGIGTAAPAAGLHVDVSESGSSTALGVLLRGGTSGNPSLELRGSSSSPYIDFVENTNLNYSTRLISQAGSLSLLWGNSGTKPAAIFNVEGGIQATNIIYTSDRRFKQHIRPLTSALTSVLALRGVRYEWNALGVQRGGTAGAGQVGLIAQELEQIYPELVSTGADGYKAVNYAQLTPVLIEAIKELKAENDALKAAAARTATELQTVQAQAAQATATTEAFEARLRSLEAGGGQARK
jgi:fibronectin-binding autotransporter adhesin